MRRSRGGATPILLRFWSRLDLGLRVRIEALLIALVDDFLKASALLAEKRFEAGSLRGIELRGDLVLHTFQCQRGLQLRFPGQPPELFAGGANNRLDLAALRRRQIELIGKTTDQLNAERLLRVRSLAANSIAGAAESLPSLGAWPPSTRLVAEALLVKTPPRGHK